MTRSVSALVTVTALMVAGCGDGSTPTAPSTAAVDTFFTAMIDGEAFTASILVASTAVNDGRAYLSLIALNGCGLANTQVLMNAYKLDSSTLTVGTYSTTKSVQIPMGPGVTRTQRELTGQVLQNNQNWMAPSTTGSGSGTLTITALPSGYVEGSFALVAAPDFGNSSGSNRSVNGTFRAKIEEKRIC